MRFSLFLFSSIFISISTYFFSSHFSYPTKYTIQFGEQFQWIEACSIGSLESLLNPFPFIYRYYYFFFGMGKSCEMTKKKKTIMSKQYQQNQRRQQKFRVNVIERRRDQHLVCMCAKCCCVYVLHLWTYDVRRVSFKWENGMFTIN